jgi:hypothetical protein
VTDLSGSVPGDAPPPRVIRNHHRFALSDVTFDGVPVGGATIDAWQIATGEDRWSARVLMSPKDVPSAGLLAGKTRDGRRLEGRVSLVGPGPAPATRGSVLVEWHGVSELRTEVVAEVAAEGD